jgi:hypothetical protein
VYTRDGAQSRVGLAWSPGTQTPLGSPCRGLRAPGEEGDRHSSFIPMDHRNIFYLSNHALAHTFTFTLSIGYETPHPPLGKGLSDSNALERQKEGVAERLT